ncbi:MAG: TlpA disulfide reductase family protein [Rikenellaceae bacterium]
MSRRFCSKISAFAVAILILSSCSADKVKVSGTFHGKPNKTIYIEQIAPKKVVVDSIKTNASGKFSFNYNVSPEKKVEFLNLRLDNGFITLLVERGEKIKINSIYNIPDGYEVEGSKGSELVKELNYSISTTSKKIDSLYTLFNTVVDATQRNDIGEEISKLYVNHKQQNIKFIVENSKSLASIMALYQKLHNGIVVFGDAMDFPYYKMVADSLNSVYPNSLHVKTLLKDVERLENRENFQNLFNNSLTNNDQISIPEISMKDMFGNEQKLSSLKGKVVLISFWSSNDKSSTLINSELKEIYSVYKDKGFEIYQISVDTSKPQWISSINTQSLPWISVNDFHGSSSSALSSYNVTQIPANYLISRSGDIIGKNLFGADLVSTIAKQF